MSGTCLQSKPLLTIGLVVRNGALHLREAVDSIQQQHFHDYQIIACDNASTDDTPHILNALVHRGLPLRVIRHTQDIGWLRNFIGAAEQADTEFFCWSTHDDLRDPRQLQVLIDLLSEHPTAGLACSAVLNMDPDGTLRDIRPETLSLRTTAGLRSAQRVLMHLRDAAGTPFYGVFRTCVLHGALPLLRDIAELPGSTMVGVDMAFVAAVIRDHDLAISPEALLHFRRGGWSHQVDLYGSLTNYLRQIWRFNSILKQATRSNAHSFLERSRINLARHSYLVRYLLSAPMRRMTWHYVSKSVPLVEMLHAVTRAQFHRDFRRFRQRCKDLPRGSRIALFGAGKHTRRCLRAIRVAAGPHVRIVGIIDDAAKSCAPIRGLPIVIPADVQSLRPNLILISSDTYEAAMFARAQSVLPAEIQIWSLYDQTLETTVSERSASSTLLTNNRISSNASGASDRDLCSGKAA